MDQLVQQCREVGIRVTTGETRWDIVLDAPERRNAQLPATWRALAAVGAAVREHRPRVVVLTAAGPSFSAGLDRRMFTGGVPGEQGLAQLAQATDEVLGALRSYKGAVVLVSHDEGAVGALEPERVLLLPDGVEDHWGPDYADLVSLA